MKIILQYIWYLISSKTEHSVHSPFIFSFIKNVIRNKYSHADLKKIKRLRNKMCQSEKNIKILDYGAGSSINNSKIRKIKDIARNSAKNAKFGQLIYKACQYMKVNTIIELGTSLGISSCYLAKGAPKSTIYSFEGCPETIKIAKENLNSLGITNVNIINGDFNNTLEKKLKEIKRFDLAFIDGNHQEKYTIEYYELLLQYSKNNTIFIFDDINWSYGMQKAWKYIKKHPRTKVTIDLFFVGIVFIKTELSEEDFKIRF